MLIKLVDEEMNEYLSENTFLLFSKKHLKRGYMPLKDSPRIVTNEMLFKCHVCDCYQSFFIFEGRESLLELSKRTFRNIGLCDLGFFLNKTTASNILPIIFCSNEYLNDIKLTAIMFSKKGFN